MPICEGQAGAKVVAYPAPKGIPASKDYTVEVAGQRVFVYTAKVLRGGPVSLAYFDFSGAVTVRVVPKAGAGAGTVVRPLSRGVKAAAEGGVITFRLDRPGNFSIEPNGRTARPLLLFANPLEEDPPAPGDRDVMYFGPGIHEIGHTVVPGGKTVYIAGGAVVRGKLTPGEKPRGKSFAGKDTYGPLLLAKGAEKVCVRGRGIIDMSGLDWHARATLVAQGCTDVRIEGVIILDSPAWCVTVNQCRKVVVTGVKAVGHRENSDGIDICNSRDVRVEGCFVRTNDDEICIKANSPPPAPEPRNITVADCVVWNERAHGLGITYETRTNVRDVLFRNCDVIHDFGFASLAVYIVDSGTMSGIRFEDCRAEDTRGRFILLKIGHDMWAHDKTRGHIKGVTFKNVSLTGRHLPGSEISGWGAGNLVEDVTFDHLRIGGKLIHDAAAGRFSIRHARNIRFLADAPPRR